MAHIIKFGDNEYLYQDNRFYELVGWQNEEYNSRVYKVPILRKEISDGEIKSLLKKYIRKKKLKRVIYGKI